MKGAVYIYVAAAAAEKGSLIPMLDSNIPAWLYDQIDTILSPRGSFGLMTFSSTQCKSCESCRATCGIPDATLRGQILAAPVQLGALIRVTPCIVLSILRVISGVGRHSASPP